MHRAVPGEQRELRAKRAEASVAGTRFCCRCAAGTTAGSISDPCRRKAVRTERHARSARPPNGLEVNPRGQGPRG